jgi:hypothetical protein
MRQIVASCPAALDLWLAKARQGQWDYRTIRRDTGGLDRISQPRAAQKDYLSLNIILQILDIV